MKIDRKKVAMLCSMSDEKMWNTVRFFAVANGITLTRRPSRQEIQNLKEALGSLTDGDLSRVNEFLNIYKYGRQK